MTNFEFIQSTDIETLAKFLNNLGFDDTPWAEWFNRKYCEKCETVKGKVDYDHNEHEFSYCEFEHKCRFVDDDSWEDPEANVLAWLRTDDDE